MLFLPGMVKKGNLGLDRSTPSGQDGFTRMSDLRGAGTSPSSLTAEASCGRAYVLVSVLMPVRNEARFVARSLHAILTQDYPVDRLEVIVADGLSDDGTRECVRDIAQRDSRVQMIDNPGRIVSTGMNAAIRHARGEIIIRVDGHCEIARDYVRRCVAHLENGDAEAIGGS
ncbi:MAG TPA: glycosyltransferase, partial [Sinorhizobium sp.]|nr:glycosyltransferase [Sinorhizobium sp.]